MSTKIISEIADYEERLSSIQSKLKNLTVPLFHTNKALRPQLAATGFFLKIESRVYLITASHVFDGLAEQSEMELHIGAIPPKITPFPEGSNVYRSQAGVGSKKNQSLDIAVVPISKSSELYDEVIHTAIDIQSTMHRREFSNVDIQFLHGFPISINKFAKNVDLENKNLKVDSYGYAYQFYELDDFEKYGKDSTTHYAIAWTSKQNGKKITHPRGCSGAGYWFFPDRHDLNKMFLAGVFIEYHKNANLGFVTRIDAVIKYISSIESDK